MSDARQQILARLGAVNDAKFTFPDKLQPAFVAQAGSLVKLLSDKLQAVHGSVDIVSTESEIAESIERFLKANDCPLEVAVISGQNDLNGERFKGVKAYPCDDFSSCRTLFVHAALGIAETGTLVLPSDADHPTLANFLPDNCIMLLRERDIVPWLEDALLAIQGRDEGMPRALNLISGPSKTADIEQTLVYGAHGPIRLHLIITP